MVTTLQLNAKYIGRPALWQIEGSLVNITIADAESRPDGVYLKVLPTAGSGVSWVRENTVTVPDAGTLRIPRKFSQVFRLLVSRLLASNKAGVRIPKTQKPKKQKVVPVPREHRYW